MVRPNATGAQTRKFRSCRLSRGARFGQKLASLSKIVTSPQIRGIFVRIPPKRCRGMTLPSSSTPRRDEMKKYLFIAAAVGALAGPAMAEKWAYR
jgi:hypothetical protein